MEKVMGSFLCISNTIWRRKLWDKDDKILIWFWLTLWSERSHLDPAWLFTPDMLELQIWGRSFSSCLQPVYTSCWFPSFLVCQCLKESERKREVKENKEGKEGETEERNTIMGSIMLGLERCLSGALRAQAALPGELGLIARTWIVAHKYPQLNCQVIWCARQDPRQNTHTELHAGKSTHIHNMKQKYL